MSNADAGLRRPVATQGWKRWEPLTGVAVVVLFIGSVVASMPPADSASNKVWVANYTGHGNQAGHFATGILLVLAGLCLASFLTSLWTRIATARRSDSISPLPLVAAGISAACFAVGGILMAGVSATLLLGSPHMPSADLLRFGNDLGFGMVGVGGMLAASLSVACLSVQARAAGIFGSRLMVFGLVVAVVLLGSIAFIPIAALLIWLIVVAIVLTRRGSDAVSAPALSSQP